MEFVRRLRHLKSSTAHLVNCSSANGRSIDPVPISRLRKLCSEDRGRSAGIGCLGKGTRPILYQEQRASFVSWNAANSGKSEQRENKQKHHWWRAQEAKWHIGAAIAATASAGTIAFSKLEISGVASVDDIEKLYEIVSRL
jgi:hypothetical protein